MSCLASVIPPIKAASNTKETTSNGNTNRLSKICPSNSVDVPDVVIISESKVFNITYEKIQKIESDTANAKPLFLSLSNSAFCPNGALVIIIPNKKRTITAPM